MNERDLAEILQEMVDGAIQGSEAMVRESAGELTEAVESAYAETVNYQQGGYLTSDPGFVLRVGCEEFQVTVLRRR